MSLSHCHISLQCCLFYCYCAINLITILHDHMQFGHCIPRLGYGIGSELGLQQKVYVYRYTIFSIFHHSTTPEPSSIWRLYHATLYLHMCPRARASTYKYIYTYVCVCVYVCVSVGMQMCMRVCVFVCVCEYFRG